MKITHLLLPILITLPLVACDAKDDAKEDGSDTTAAKDTSGPCAGAAALAKVAVLEVDKTPDDPKAGAKFVKTLQAELTAECQAKGYDKSASDALACYDKNKKKTGYRVWKGCDQEVGKKLVSAIVAKHGA